MDKYRLMYDIFIGVGASSVDAALQTLTDRERLVLTHYYENQSCRTIGEMIGRKANPNQPLSSERVRQIKEMALRKLRHPSRSKLLREISPLEIEVKESPEEEWKRLLHDLKFIPINLPVDQGDIGTDKIVYLETPIGKLIEEWKNLPDKHKEILKNMGIEMMEDGVFLHPYGTSPEIWDIVRRLKGAVRALGFNGFNGIGIKIPWLYLSEKKRGKGYEMEGFKNWQVAERTKLAPRIIQYYTDRGVVVPEIYPGNGSRGSHRVYSVKNIVEFMLIEKLTKLGITFSVLKRLVRLTTPFMAKWDQVEAPTYLLFSVGGKFDIEYCNVNPDVRIKPLLENSASVLIIDFAEIVKKVKETS